VTDPPTFDRVLVDTGPLVAIRNPYDSQHARCIATLRQIKSPLLTCWPVVTEAAWMLRHNPLLTRRLLRSVADGNLEVLEIDGGESSEIESLFARYADLSPQLADAALLHLAQRDGLDTVFTLDRRDFSVFRLRANKRLRLLPEEG